MSANDDCLNVCIFCNDDISGLSPEAKQLHMNFCMSNEEGSSFVLSDDESDDKDFQVKSGNVEQTWCQICGKSISHLQLIDKTKHIEKCCVSQSQKEKEAKENTPDSVSDSSDFYCSACGVCLKGKSADYKIKHFRKCHKQKNTSLEELKKIRAAKDKEISETRATSKKTDDTLQKVIQPPNSNFMNVLHKAHYRPQTRPITPSPVGPSPPGEKDLAGFKVTQRTTQVKKQMDTDNCIQAMFSDDESSIELSFSPVKPSNAKSSAQPVAIPAKWKLSTELAKASQYKTNLLENIDSGISPSSSNASSSNNSDSSSGEKKSQTEIPKSTDKEIVEEPEENEDEDLVSLASMMSDSDSELSLPSPIIPRNSPPSQLLETESPVYSQPLRTSPTSIESSLPLSSANTPSPIPFHLFPRSQSSLPTSPPIHTDIPRRVSPPQQPQLSQIPTPISPIQIQIPKPPTQTPRKRSNRHNTVTIQSPTANLPKDFVQQLQGIQEWYKKEVNAYEQEKQRAIAEIENKFYAQIGRLAMSKEQKLDEVSKQFNVPSEIRTISHTISGILTSPTMPRISQNSSLSTPSKRPRSTSQTSSTSSQPKRRRLNSSTGNVSSSNVTPMNPHQNNNPPAPTSTITEEQSTPNRGSTGDEIHHKLGVCIRSDKSLWTRMLLQETVNITELQNFVKDKGINCGMDILKSYLRAEGVLFQKPRRKTKRTKTGWGSTRGPSG